MNAWSHLPNAERIDLVLRITRGAAWDAARGAARDAAWVAAWDAAWVAARGAIAALVAWDDAGGLLGMPADALKLLAASGHAPAVLLLPFCTLFEKELGL